MIASFVAALAVSLATTPASGLYGVVRKGPTKPVCEIGTPCTAPAVALKLVFVRDGRIAAGVTTGTGGRYRLALRPGTYVVRTALKLGIGRGLDPTRVVVPRARFARVDFMLDTGIR
jgi:hypothetical protein